MQFLKDSIAFRDSPHHLRMLVLFMIASFFVIALTTAVFGTLLSSYLTRQMVARDAVVSMEFLNSIVRVENAAPYFRGERNVEPAPDMEELFHHVGRFPDVFRANVYGMDGTILWSSLPGLIGQKFTDNDDLAAAMHGEINPEIKRFSDFEKDEHVNFPDSGERFIESYLPIWSEDRSRVVGAVEIYKAPAKLLSAIAQVNRLCTIGGAVGAMVLFGALLVVVVYTTRILRRQEARLVEAERLAVIGEMTSAVAHGLRNPLAAIRSCAELALDDDLPQSSRQPIADIVEQSDRLESWIRSFLRRSRNDPSHPSEQISVDSVVRHCLDHFAAQFENRAIIVELVNEGPEFFAVAERAEVEQVINSILANSIEAMKQGGMIRITRSIQKDGKSAIRFADTGPGVPKEMLDRLFEPFQTGKPSGLGVGLALARRIAERLGGSIELRNRAERGVEVTFTLPNAAAKA